MITRLSRKVVYFVVALATLFSLGAVSITSASAGEKKIGSTVGQACATDTDIPASGVFVCWEKG